MPKTLELPEELFQHPQYLSIVSSCWTRLQHHLEAAEPHPRVSDSTGLGWYPRILHKFPIDVLLLAQGPCFEKHCLSIRQL